MISAAALDAAGVDICQIAALAMWPYDEMPYQIYQNLSNALCRALISRRSAPRYFLVCGLAQVKCLSQGYPLKHDGRRKTTKRKNEQKGFKGSSTGPPGEEIPRVPLRDLRGEKNKHKNTGTYH